MRFSAAGMVALVQLREGFQSSPFAGEKAGAWERNLLMSLAVIFLCAIQALQNRSLSSLCFQNACVLDITLIIITTIVITIIIIIVVIHYHPHHSC